MLKHLLIAVLYLTLIAFLGLLLGFLVLGITVMVCRALTGDLSAAFLLAVLAVVSVVCEWRSIIKEYRC